MASLKDGDGELRLFHTGYYYLKERKWQPRKDFEIIIYPNRQVVLLQRNTDWMAAYATMGSPRRIHFKHPEFCPDLCVINPITSPQKDIPAVHRDAGYYSEIKSN